MSGASPHSETNGNALPEHAADLKLYDEVILPLIMDIIDFNETHGHTIPTPANLVQRMEAARRLRPVIGDWIQYAETK